MATTPDSALPADLGNLRSADRQGGKRHVVRSAQLATAMLVAVAVVATVATRSGQLSVARLFGLAATGAAYVGWTLYGTREAARFVLWHHLPTVPLAHPEHSGEAER